MHYRSILVVGAHPDDEMTMGGTMAWLASRGTRVYVATMTDGCEGYPRLEMKDTIVETRRAEQAEADKVLGVRKRFQVGAPDQGLEDRKEYLLRLIRAIREAKPQALFLHGPVDGHRDHRAAHRLGLDAHFHSGEPVNSDLGAPHRAAHLYYYKGVGGLAYPRIDLDVTAYGAHCVRAILTQRSQFAVFRRGESEFRKLLRAYRSGKSRRVESFWIPEGNVYHSLLPPSLR